MRVGRKSEFFFFGYLGPPRPLLLSFFLSRLVLFASCRSICACIRSRSISYILPLCLKEKTNIPTKRSIRLCVLCSSFCMPLPARDGVLFSSSCLSSSSTSCSFRPPFFFRALSLVPFTPFFFFCFLASGEWILTSCTEQSLPVYVRRLE